MNRAIESRKKIEVKRSQLTDLRDSDTFMR